jgi:hypothetical protein
MAWRTGGGLSGESRQTTDNSRVDCRHASPCTEAEVIGGWGVRGGRRSRRMVLVHGKEDGESLIGSRSIGSRRR